MNERKYGWKRQLPDFRDYRLSVARLLTAQPFKTSLRLYVKEIYNQGATGSCTANALAQAMRITQLQEKLTDIAPSRLFIYYNERLKEGTVSSDAGADLRDGMKVIADLGAPVETDWPFNPAEMFNKPSAASYENAVQNMVKTYVSINQDIYDLKQSIISGYPFVFGFSVYSSFESDAVAATGIVPLPSTTDSLQGGHAVCAVGYDDVTQTFEVVNSWGADWGDKGFFHLPYSYILNPDLASDFWSITMLETQNDPTRKWLVPTS